MTKLRVVPQFAAPDDVDALAEEKLSSSGISKADAVRLGIEWLSADAVKTLHQGHWVLPALKINYFSAKDPEKPLKPAPNWPDFYRLRALREPVPKDKNFRKYLQEENSGLCAYMPRILRWDEIMADYTVPIIITEGELKSACACLHGYPTIGLGGVYSFRATRAGHMLLPELVDFVWPRRQVHIIFDSDARENEQICKALWELAEELQSRGAMPCTVMLPSDGPDSPKVGLDDLLVKEGKKALDALLEDSEPLTLASTLWGINETFAYIEEPGLVVRQATGFMMKPDAFKSHALPKLHMENRLLPNGVVSKQKVKAGEAWIDWGLRKTARKVSYKPGDKPLSVVEEDGVPVFNTWVGWGAEPKKGDVRLFKQLVDHLFAGADSASKEYFLKWLAYPVANPGVKMFVAAVFIGLEHGTGKSLIGSTMGKVYGVNYMPINQENMEGSFNSWANSRQFVMVDDVTSTDRRRDIDRLKAMITRETVWINIKNLPEFPVTDCTNFYFSSNRPDVLLLDANDRRFYIHEVLSKPLPAEFYLRYDAWMRGPDCGAAMHYYLKHEVDLTGFNPSAAPPMTAAKAKMIGLARTDIESWLTQLLDAPDEFLCLGEMKLRGDMFTLSEIRAAFEAYQGKPLEISQITLSRRLAALGVRQVNEGKNLYVPGRKLDTYWILRNREKWHKAPLDHVKRHIGEVTASSRMRGG